MNSMDELLGELQQIDPLWSVVLAAIALAILVIARLWSGSLLKLAAAGAGLLVLAGMGSAGYYGYLHLEDTRRIEERRLFEERAAPLFRRSVEPDSVFTCLDGTPVPALQEGCERTLFAEPQRVAAAVAIVTQRLAFIEDALKFAERDPTYLERIEPLRKSSEADPYGFVAFVFSVEHQCTAESCARFHLLRDATRVKENMRVRRLEAYMAKHSVNWRESTEDASVATKPSSAPLVTISEPADARSSEKSRQKQPDTSAAEVDAKEASSEHTPTPHAPVAATAPTITPPTEPDGTSETPRPATADNAPAPKQSTPEAPSAAKRPPPPQPRPPGQSKAKSADQVSRRTSEPVGGLPRVVPSEYVRDSATEEGETTAQAEGRPGVPTPISPLQQNFR